MDFFRKNRTENLLIKLFKITDNKTAKQFDMESCILSTIDSITTITDLKATNFDINFRDSRRTLTGFKKVLKINKEIVYGFVGFDSEKTKTHFTISNPMLNWTEQPENASIDISIQIACQFIDLTSSELIAEKLFKAFNFEYGYITKLPSNFNSETERKIKKSLFSTSVEINEIDHAWTFHSVGILYGFIKQLYPINYLNKSHFIDSTIKELILEFGKIENITQEISKWTLGSEEIVILKNMEQIQNISIITPDLRFLKTKKAKLFNIKMELNGR